MCVCVCVRVCVCKCVCGVGLGGVLNLVDNTVGESHADGTAEICFCLSVYLSVGLIYLCVYACGVGVCVRACVLVRMCLCVCKYIYWWVGIERGGGGLNGWVRICRRHLERQRMIGLSILLKTP